MGGYYITNIDIRRGTMKLTKSVLVIAIVAIVLFGFASCNNDTPAPAGTAITEESQFAKLEAGETYYLADNIKAKAQITIAAANVTINGNGKTISRDVTTEGTVGEKAIILVTANDVTISNLNVSGVSAKYGDKWNEGEFGIKVYNATGVTLEDITVTKANAGIQVNSSEVTVKGKINVSGNAFGGIGVDKANTGDLRKGALTVNASTEISCTDDSVPAIWLESDDKAEEITGEGVADLIKATPNDKEKKTQIWYLASDQVTGFKTATPDTAVTE